MHQLVFVSICSRSGCTLILRLSFKIASCLSDGKVLDICEVLLNIFDVLAKDLK